MNRYELLAYLAGLVDGEGAISISKRTDSKDASRRHPRYYPRIWLKNKNKEVIILLKKVFGGCIWREDISCGGKGGFRKSELWVWERKSDKVFEIVKSLYPFLIIKKPQANIILKFEKVKKEARKVRKNSRIKGKPFEARFVKKFEKLYQEIRKLNKH